MDKIPAELVTNQTGINYVPVSGWTMAEKGSKRVNVTGKDDKLSSLRCYVRKFSFQLVYQGKTTKCLPKHNFPADWDITFTANHSLVQ